MIDPFLIEASDETFDAIVVGSGITGGWAAKELCEKGLRVLMIERGRPVHHGKDYIGESKAPWELPHRGKVDYLISTEQQHVQRKCYAYNDATKHFFANDQDSPYQTAQGKPFDWIRGNQLGGKSLLWHRQSYRWSDLDFEANAKDGHGVDWPIRYKDIAPWYSYVEKFIGISGSKDNIAVLPDSEFLPPFEMNAVEKYAQAKIAKHFKDRQLIMGRTAHISKATSFFLDQGRGQCMTRNECQRGCSFGAYFSTLSSTLPAALKTNKLKIACHSIVEKLNYDSKRNRLSGVSVIDERTGKKREYRANMVFMCASTIGTTQVMLNSRSDAFPNGIANSSGTLGRYLMDHVYNAGGFGLIDGFDNDYYSGRRPTGLYIPRFVNVDKNDKPYLRGFSLAGSAQRANWQRANFVESADFGESLKTDLKQPGTWFMNFGSSGEMLPRHQNFMRLDKTKVDKWGMPQIEFNCSFGENEHKMMDDIEQQVSATLSAIGAKNINVRRTDAPPGLAIHEMGTARMGKDKKTSVLNAHNQSHDIPNLFVTDGACMSSSAWQNPSLTYMALTARAADYAVKEYKRGRL